MKAVVVVEEWAAWKLVSLDNVLNDSQRSIFIIKPELTDLTTLIPSFQTRKID